MLKVLVQLPPHRKHSGSLPIREAARNTWYFLNSRAMLLISLVDSQIMLFLADDMACNGRNAEIGAVYNHKNKLIDLYGNDVEVDFRGEEVTVENLVRLLTGRQDEG